MRTLIAVVFLISPFFSHADEEWIASSYSSKWNEPGTQVTLKFSADGFIDNPLSQEPVKIEESISQKLACKLISVNFHSLSDDWQKRQYCVLSLDSGGNLLNIQEADLKFLSRSELITNETVRGNG